MATHSVMPPVTQVDTVPVASFGTTIEDRLGNEYMYAKCAAGVAAATGVMIDQTAKTTVAGSTLPTIGALATSQAVVGANQWAWYLVKQRSANATPIT